MTGSSSIRTLGKYQRTRFFENPSRNLHQRAIIGRPDSTGDASSNPPCPKTLVSPEARRLFDRSPQRAQTGYSRSLSEYSRYYQNQGPLDLFASVHRWGLPVDGSALSCVINVCANSFDQNAGKQVHCQCVKSGFLEDVSVGSALVDMYMKTESVEDGRRAFDEVADKSVVSWTSLLSGYARNSLNGEAIELFRRMQVEGIKPNAFTYTAVLGALGDDDLAEKGIQLHAMVIKDGFASTTYSGNSLINMYSKVGMIRDARAVFNMMGNKDVVSWNSMISGYVANGHDMEALVMFHSMRNAEVSLSQLTFANVIKLCANVREISFARQLHCQVVKVGLEFDDKVGKALIVAYSKCCEMDDAFKSFSSVSRYQDVVSWTAIITGYLQNGQAAQAVDLFCQMRRGGVKPNDFTYSLILGAQPLIAPHEVHAQVIKNNYQSSSTVGTALLDAYVKIGSTDTAAKVFKSVHEKDVVSWSAMLAGYALSGDTENAVKVYLQLGKEGVRPNEFTYSSVINACAAPSAAVEQGKQLHARSIKSGYSDALCVSSALLTMYAKRGNIESASKLFQRQRERDLVSWNSMISGYAQHGHAKKALEVFKEMQRQKMTMDSITFIAVISACTHGGFVEEGERYYDMMINNHQISPTMEHYSCMVDLYSRAGMLEKAMDTINGMPFPASVSVWRSILAGCHVQRNLELGKLAAEKLISLQPDHSSSYVLLSNIYAAAGKWRERAEVRRMMDERKVRKEAGYSWIEVKNKTYYFLASDVTHPLQESIYAKLEELGVRLRDYGYQPDTNYVLHDVEEEHKEAILSQHSERLALAFGLIATSPEIPIHISKNLRVCGDCHNVIKLVSMIESREIIVRDSNRFHHFNGGSCSCGDYW
ncbi:LOW QUALITY PROTEIN: pentatricopeptide repeat-containing protein At2g27610 [Rhodamnia argentea]|uniref:LOW QUALITY PROTEIN: pentatricopeptide repeat-containing protein At2g27610 n=1 Tax=Rhodamnia argentea TaxID=178133 RepID=A0ABM3HI01_9MYRT|nr:LOW QUALITY PROTEIN: pentatricopeptide repeat-containing protein At2g27610 [Rhodamnia argentea]